MSSNLTPSAIDAIFLAWELVKFIIEIIIRLVKMVKTYIWDIDGVLVWHHPTDPAQDWRAILIEKNWLEIWEAFQKSEWWLECLTDPGKNVQEQLSQFMRQTGDDAHNSEEIIDIWLANNIKVNRAAYECLLDLRSKGHPCAIASNQDFRRAGFLATWFSKGGLANIPYFISCDIQLIKPDLQFYEKIQSTLHKQGNELVLLDDRQENIQSAHKLGWGTHHITENFDWRSFREGVMNGKY